jgi:acyl-CoA reductase-like NAD-dependent aldehyde dehydrogenase
MLAVISNFIGGLGCPADSGETFQKRSPVTGEVLSTVARSRIADVERAVAAAKAAQRAWGSRPGVERGAILHAVCRRLQDRREDVARVVAAETGKGFKNALTETDGAIQLGLFFAGEGQRFYGRTTNSGTPHKSAMTVREPLGVAALIIAANTPIANAAWKIFPALICGNGVVLKAAEDTPATAAILAEIMSESGLPAGLFNVLQGYGDEAGAPLVEHRDVSVISFTGSTAVGRRIAVTAGQQLKRVSLELGGTNPLVVCDDADLEQAAKWVLLSAFSNAGQRCAAGSRIIIFDAVYDRFRDMLVERTRKLRVGPHDGDDFGPLISERHLRTILDAIEAAQTRGARVLIGGYRLEDPEHVSGYFLAATLLEGLDPSDETSTCELFAPVATLFRVGGFEEALALANDSPYGLTACIHTRNINRAFEFVRRVQSGVAVVNAGTFGSEPHMPFGGIKQSGNGSREPGTEALDVYSNLKGVYIQVDVRGL